MAHLGATPRVAADKREELLLPAPQTSLQFSRKCAATKSMAKGGLETAIWDAEAKQKNIPLAQLLGGTRTEIACGVSIGIQPSIPALLEKVEKRTERRIPAHQNQNQAGAGR